MVRAGRMKTMKSPRGFSLHLALSMLLLPPPPLQLPSPPAFQTSPTNLAKQTKLNTYTLEEATKTNQLIAELVLRFAMSTT